jgi:hypothetical protein
MMASHHLCRECDVSSFSWVIRAHIPGLLRWSVWKQGDILHRSLWLLLATWTTSSRVNLLMRIRAAGLLPHHWERRLEWAHWHGHKGCRKGWRQRAWESLS